MNQSRWQVLMISLGLPPSLDVYKALVNAYSQRRRYYHNIHHINDCLKQLDMVGQFATQVQELELALWFHDAVYKPLSSHNEWDSAKWARRFLLENSADNTRSQRIHELIVATRHTSVAIDNDTKLLIDIDLSILGSNTERYQQFEKAIRQEYKIVPGFLFRKKRRLILQSFLNRKRIYQHKFFFERLEQKARTNLSNAIRHIS